MKFRDQQLQQLYDKTVACISGCPAEQLPILALLDALYWFQLIEGEQSPKVKELLEKLLSPELRPALRTWDQRFGDNINTSTLKFREQLSVLAVENFGCIA
jgi:Ni,Fe-hydrogenase I small subunit